jgi:sulfur carrier protein ThiS
VSLIGLPPAQAVLWEEDVAFLHESSGKWKWKTRRVLLSRDAVISYTDNSLYKKQRDLLKLTASSSVGVTLPEQLRETAFPPEPFLLQVEGDPADDTDVHDETSNLDTMVVFALRNEDMLNDLKKRLEQIILGIRSPVLPQAEDMAKHRPVRAACLTVTHFLTTHLQILAVFACFIFIFDSSANLQHWTMVCARTFRFAPPI